MKKLINAAESDTTYFVIVRYMSGRESCVKKTRDKRMAVHYEYEYAQMPEIADVWIEED